MSFFANCNNIYLLQIVKQMPIMVRAKQPTITIITAKYCEKLAVDSMIENKETFVRYTTVGKFRIYTYVVTIVSRIFIMTEHLRINQWM